MTDPDIGRCDDCGSEAGPRTATPRVVTINGKPTNVTAWLCVFCRVTPFYGSDMAPADEWADECAEFGCDET